MRILLAIVVCSHALQSMRAAELRTAGVTDPLTITGARVAVTGYDLNRPDPFPGMGDFGWAGNIQRLADGRLMLVHQWGYWHSSFAEPVRLLVGPRAADTLHRKGDRSNFPKRGISKNRTTATTSVPGSILARWR